jgi:outer membrane receptor protein involved in Fe transport
MPPLRAGAHRARFWCTRGPPSLKVALAALAAASPAHGQDAPRNTGSAATAPPAAAPRSDDSQEIVVTALPSDRSSIDRTTYVVRDNPESRAASAMDLVARIPSVDASSQAQIRLFGRSGVKLLIDGREVANPVIVLRNLQGAQIARIEVISNPSAQFSAQGTAGIINVITRRAHGRGLGGSLTAGAGSLGTYTFKASPTWDRGRLTWSGSLGASRSVSRTEAQRNRYRSDPGVPLALEQSDDADIRGVNDSLSASTIATYRLSDRRTLSLAANATHADGAVRTDKVIVFPGQASGTLTQTAKSPIPIRSLDYSLEYRAEGQRKGELLTIAAQRSTSTISSRAAFVTASGGAATSLLSVYDSNSTTTSSIKMDYVRPVGARGLMTVGAALERCFSGTDYAETGNLPLGQAVNGSSTFNTTWTDKAAYATYQFPIGTVTFLPGLRAESRKYDLAGATARALSGTRLFPTLHVERPFGSKIHMDLSYSRRIAWPNTGALDPSTRLTDSTTATVGNPLLRPEITDSYEAKFSAKLGKQSLDITAFDRRTRDLFSNISELDTDRILVAHTINAGILVLRGADISLRGPLGRHLRYSASGDVADESISKYPVAAPTVHPRVQYSMVGQIEYFDGVEGRKGADHVTLSVRHYGPIASGLYLISATSSLSVSWSHLLTDRVSTLFSLGGVSIPRSRSTTSYAPSTVSREVYRPVGIRAFLSLSYSLRAPSQQ